jgi:ribosomal protein S18 acetylase RimI-like enzyme
MTDITIHRAEATGRDIARVAPLFDAYRQFYEQPSDLARATAFIRARLAADESIVLLAVDRSRDDAGVGFVQLYRLFSSVSATRILVLNDLYVSPDYRRLGVARALMNAARAFAADAGVETISLETADDNVKAQALYESLGYAWTPSTFRTYILDLARPVADRSEDLS